MKFSPLINVKMIVGILAFISRINDWMIFKNLQIPLIVLMSNSSFMLSGVEHENFHDLGAWSHTEACTWLEKIADSEQKNNLIKLARLI